VPNAPSRSLRELYTLAAELIGVRPRITEPPRALMSVLGLFMPTIRELAEMRFHWNQPYLVDASKFSRRFWNDPTSFDRGLRATIEYYRIYRS
jgi:nucleoside-diphosphate-sugar epimerase